jgi:hypothetical protein
MPIFRFESRIVLFVHIPKTGGTSVEKMLKDAGGIEALRYSEPVAGLPCTPQHFHADIITRLLPEKFCDLAFTIVRNPYDRLVSEFKMRVLEARRDLAFDAWVERAFGRYSRNPFANDNHIRPQSEFLLDRVEVFRFEDQPLLRIAERLATLDIPPVSDHPWERRSAATMLTLSPATAARIREFYAVDFERLGYRPDDYGSSLKPAEGV